MLVIIIAKCMQQILCNIYIVHSRYACYNNRNEYKLKERRRLFRHLPKGGVDMYDIEIILVLILLIIIYIKK